MIENLYSQFLKDHLTTNGDTDVTSLCQRLYAEQIPLSALIHLHHRALLPLVDDLGLDNDKISTGASNFLTEVMQQYEAVRQKPWNTIDSPAYKPMVAAVQKHSIPDIRAEHVQFFFKALLENTPYYLYMKNLEGRHVFVNSAFEKLIGLPLSEIVGKTNAELFRMDVLDNIDANDRKVIELASSFQFEETAYIDNQLRQFTVMKFPIYDENHQIIGIGGIATDDTELKHLLKIITQRENDLQTMFNSLPTPVILTEMEEGTILFANAAFSRFSGIASQEIEAYKVIDFLPIHARRSYIDQLKKHHAIDNTELDVTLPNGRTATVFGSAQMIEYHGQKAILKAFIDMTDYRRMDSDLKKSRELYQTLAENMAGVVMLNDLEGRVIYISPSVEWVLGYQPEEWVGHFPPEFIYEDDRERILNILNTKAQVIDRLVLPPHRFVSKSGKLIWMDNTVKRLYDSQGKLTGFVGTMHDITNEYNALAALRINEQRYRSLFEQSHDGVFLIDLDGSYIEVNDRAAEILGYPRDELREKHASEVVHSDERAHGNQIIASLMRGETIPVYERRFVKKDGSIVVGEMSVTLVYDDYGKPMHVQSILHDVTEHRALMKSLEESRRFIEQITMAVPDIIYVYDVETMRNVYSNREISTVLGYTPEQIAQINFMDIVHPEDIARGVLDPQRYQVLATEGKILENESRIKDSEGQWRWISVRDAAFAKNPDGSVKQVIGVAQDITERRRLQEQLLMRNQAIEYSPVAIVICDAVAPDMPIVYANPAFYTITGYDMNEVIGHNCRLLQGTDKDQPEIDVIRTAIKNGEACEVVLRNYKKDGAMFWNQLRLSPIRSQSGQIVYYIGIQNDITSVRTAEEQLQQALIAEQELNRLRTRFVSMASHEFRTPLTIIRSAMETLRDHYDKMNEEQRARRYRAIDEQVVRAIHMLDDVMALGRMDSGRERFKPEWVDIQQYITGFIEDFSVAYPSHKIDFTWNATITDAWIDRQMFHHILSNLLSNAVKYSPESDRVDLAVNMHENDLCIRIRDYGIGIPKSDQEKLFRGFERASNVGKIQGTGLGLPIVQRAVELHGGSLSFESQENQGTTFFVRLPQQPEYKPER